MQFQKKTYSNFTKSFCFPNARTWMKVLCKDCTTVELNNPFPRQKQLAEKQHFKGR